MSKEEPPAYNPQAPAGQPYPPPGQAPYQGYPPPEQQYPPPQQQYPPQGQPYPPTGPYPPPAGHQQNTVVVAAPTVVVPQATFREAPVQMTCPHCQASIVTSTTYETGTLTWLIFGGLCIFGFWLCCCIPFCVDACKDVIHTCPNCTRIIGTYKRI